MASAATVMRPRTALLFLLGAVLGPVLAARAEAEEPGPGGQVAPQFSGRGYYEIRSSDASGADLGDWSVSQEIGARLRVRTRSGLDFFGDLVSPIGIGSDTSPAGALRQLYLRFSPLDSLTLIAGRQRLNWGSAKVFSAIDALESRADPLDEGSSLSGIGGVKAVFIPTDWLSMSGIVIPEIEIERTRGALRADIVVDDINLDIGFGVAEYAYLERGGPPPSSGETSNRLAFISDSALSIGDLVVYEESQLRRGRQTGYFFPGMTGFESFGGSDAMVLRADIGAMLRLEIGLSRPMTLVAEYLFNGDGLADDEASIFADRYGAWKAGGAPSGTAIPGSILGLGGFRRHYVALLAKDIAIGRYLLGGASGIASPDSGLARLELSLEWQASQESSIRLSYERFWSLDDSEIGEDLFLPFRNRISLAFAASF